MLPEGYVEYKRREFCKDVNCPVQIELNKQKEGCSAYEETRKKCRGNGCLCTTWQFHHFLIEKGYLIIVNSKLKNNQITLLANLDKNLVDWIDKQVKIGKYRDKDQLVENAIIKLKESL
jgi:hypothetical protein